MLYAYFNGKIALFQLVLDRVYLHSSERLLELTAI
jgi:AcrR family transcriptional regulator